jgi:hypothetical protein
MEDWMLKAAILIGIGGLVGPGLWLIWKRMKGK